MQVTPDCTCRGSRKIFCLKENGIIGLNTMPVSAGSADAVSSQCPKAWCPKRFSYLWPVAAAVLWAVSRNLWFSPPVSPPLNRLERVTLCLDKSGIPLTVSGDDFGESSPVRCLLGDGQAGVLKLDKPRNLVERKGEQGWWTYQAVSSYIMSQMGCPTVKYREACADYRGVSLRGLACEEIWRMRTLSDYPESLPRIKNADQAILGTVVTAWLGDFDRIIKNENVWVDSRLEVVYGDYGCAGMEHVSAFGVIPKVNRSLFARLATPQNVAKALGRVRNLSDQQIREMVAGGGMLLATSRPEVLEEMIATLIRNRDELRSNRAWALDLIGPTQRGAYLMPQPMADAFLKRILQRFGPSGDAEEIAQAALKDIAGYQPLHDQDRVLVQRQLRQAILEVYQGSPPELVLDPYCFYVWMQLAKAIFTSEESIQLGLGLKHRDP